MKQIEKHRLGNNWEYAKRLWKREKQKHGLSGWTLEMFHTADKVGVCKYMSKTIGLSSVFLRGHNCNYAKVKKALMHEVAHAITPGHSHNNIWKAKCKSMGGDDRLTMTMVLPGMSWAMVCPSCRWRQEYPTKPNATGMVCGSCRTPVKVKYIV
jgi:hypothetical protein